MKVASTRVAAGPGGRLADRPARDRQTRSWRWLAPKPRASLTPYPHGVFAPTVDTVRREGQPGGVGGCRRPAKGKWTSKGPAAREGSTHKGASAPLSDLALDVLRRLDGRLVSAPLLTKMRSAQIDQFS